MRRTPVRLVLLALLGFFAVSASAQTLASLALDPASVVGGATSTGTVTLTDPAPSGGAVVTLSSSDAAAATVPESVTVAEGGTSAIFTVATSPVATSTPVDISGTYGETRTATLTVNPPTLDTLTLTPTSVMGGNPSTGTVTLTGAAPSEGAVVTLSSSDTAVATVPESVTVAEGGTSATFTVTTSPVAASTPVDISGTYGETRTATLTVNPPTLSTLTLSPTSLIGGNPSTGTATLTGAAPSGGASVSLSSSNPAVATVPESVTVAEGETSATFTVTTSPVATSTPVDISGIYGETRTATLTVNRADLDTLALDPPSVIGGNPATGTVTLTGAAPSEGAVINLSSSNPTVATVPETVTVAEGETSATFTVTTSPVAASTPVTITASYGGTDRTATLTVNPLVLESLTLAPTTVVGGNPSAGMVRLTGVARAGGAVVALSSSNEAAAMVPQSVTVPQGETSASFTVTTYLVGSSTSVTISALYGGTNRTATLTVNPPATPPISYVYDELGRLVGVIDPAAGSARYSYDAVGNLLSISRQPSVPVSILRFSPKEGPVGTSVAIDGTGFSATASENSVAFNGVAATVSASTTTRILTVAPSGATTGRISVTTPSGSATSSAPFTVPPSTIAIGGPSVRVSITRVGQQARVTFSGTAGQRVSLGMTDVTLGTHWCCGSQIFIRKLDGTDVGWSWAGTSWGWIETLLPASETYTILVQPQGRNTGSITLTLSPTVTGPIAIGGASVPVSITRRGQQARLTFSGTAGQRVSLGMTNVTLGTSWCCGSQVFIRKLDGTDVGWSWAGTSWGWIETQLPASETYVVVVRPEGTNTGNITLTLSETITGTLTVGGPSFRGTITRTGQHIRLTFTGTAGQRVRLRMSEVTIGTSPCCGTRVHILKPDDTYLASRVVGTAGADLDTSPLPVNGTYVVLIQPESTNTGGITLTLSQIP